MTFLKENLVLWSSCIDLLLLAFSFFISLIPFSLFDIAMNSNDDGVLSGCREQQRHQVSAYVLRQVVPVRGILLFFCNACDGFEAVGTQFDDQSLILLFFGAGQGGRISLPHGSNCWFRLFSVLFS